MSKRNRKAPEVTATEVTATEVVATEVVATEPAPAEQQVTADQLIAAKQATEQEKLNWRDATRVTDAAIMETLIVDGAKPALTAVELARKIVELRVEKGTGVAKAHNQDGVNLVFGPKPYAPRATVAGTGASKNENIGRWELVKARLAEGPATQRELANLVGSPTFVRYCINRSWLQPVQAPVEQAAKPE